MSAATWVSSAEFMCDFRWLLSLRHHYRYCSLLRWQEVRCIEPHLRVCDVNMFLHAASAAVADAAAWRAARVRVDAWSYACVPRRWEAMPQRVWFGFRARLLGRTPASHDVGRPGRCACLLHRIIKQGALLLISHLHFLHVTSHHAHFRLVIHSTKLGTGFLSHTHSQHILFSTFSCLPHLDRCCSRLRWQQGCALQKFFWLIQGDAWCTDRIHS